MNEFVPLSDGMARSMVARLGADCVTAAAVAAVADARRERLVDRLFLSALPRSAVDRVTKDFEERGWLVRQGNAWYVPAEGMPQSVPAFLAGMAAMRDPAAAEEAAITAVTLPHAPSAIAAALPATGMSHAGLISTDDAMRRVADSAVTRLTVMSPFLNAGGLKFALELFERSPATTRTLVARGTGETKSSLMDARQDVERLELRVLDCLLPGQNGYETSHAKVVLADDRLSYVGSANLLSHGYRALELGNVVRGSAAKVVASVVRAVEAAARPWDWSA